MPPTVEGGYEAYKTFGLAGLVVFLLLFFIGYLLWTMRGNSKDQIAMTERMIKAMEDSTGTGKQQIETMERLEGLVTENTKQSSALMEYMRARDQFFGNQPPGRRSEA